MERYLEEADRIDRQETGAARTERAAHLFDRFHRVRHGIERRMAMGRALVDAPDGEISLTDPDARAMGTRAQHSGYEWSQFRSRKRLSFASVEGQGEPRR